MQEFIESIDSLVTLKSDIRELRDDIVRLNDGVQASEDAPSGSMLLRVLTAVSRRRGMNCCPLLRNWATCGECRSTLATPE